MAAICVGAVLLIRWALGTPPGRRWRDRLLLALPIVGPLARKAALSRMARTLHTLLASGVPILESLQIVQHTSGNVVMADVIKSVEAHVRQGGGVAEPLKASKQVPPMVIQMVQVGEASGTLDEMLNQVAEHYDQLIQHGIKRAMVFIEPVFLAIMGVVVACIIASVLMPLFQMVRVIR